MSCREFFKLATNDRALCRCGIRIPSARNHCPALDKDKCLEPMFGYVGQARTKARICTTADCYIFKPHLHKTHCYLPLFFIRNKVCKTNPLSLSSPRISTFHFFNLNKLTCPWIKRICIIFCSPNETTI